ncbi:uncharacterized protein LOC113493150 [Trichoplusia ni]|uniref:Uncharacterized protein LOC113493150 n=1 Tax=Trichoplusia ni TaxID=7111 RepID=A0A7E5VEP0_TRINI|nr:uncharacterized protein LOC113493150 [Trichoplusia ni]
MTQRGSLVTLGKLLDEHAATDQDEEILERVKVLAQEHLPDGWSSWEVTTATKEDLFGEKIDPNILNKLVFALPTVGLVRAFLPEADHLSEKGYRDIRCKLLDWAFTRALILGPPAVANRIRGSAARTELFKQSVETLRPLLHTRPEADRILSGSRSESEETSRKRRSTSSATTKNQEPSVRRRKRDSDSPSTSQDARIEALEQRVESMFAVLLEKLEHRQQSDCESNKENYFSSDEEHAGSETSESPSWRAPALDANWQVVEDEMELEFLPTTKEAEPLIPEPSAQIKKEGIECQRLGTDSWNRIRYKEVEKHLHAASIFSALKINTELGTLTTQPSPWLTKQENLLGTITHGLLLQRRALAENLNTIVKKCPSASTELRQLVAEDSTFKTISDQLLQFVCAHRSETIDIRRKAFKTRNEVLNNALHNIPPSPTHLFEEKQLSTLVKENGGLSAVFSSPRATERTVNSFRKPAPPVRSKATKPSWRSRPAPQYSANYHSSPHNVSSHHSSRNPPPKKPSNYGQRRGRGGSDKKSRKSRATY